MDLFSTDPDRPGVFAVGQEAVGIIALGQMATGVIAIGQVARGVIAVGQGAIGIVALGQAALGVLYAAGMFAIGGRGFGLVVKVLPKLVVQRFERPALPPLTDPAIVRGREVREGWVLARIDDGHLVAAGEPLELEATADLNRELRDAVTAGHTHACVAFAVEERALELEGGYRTAAPRERVLIGEQMRSWIEAPPRVRLEGPFTGAGALVVRAIGMVALAYAWWLGAGSDIASLFTS